MSNSKKAGPLKSFGTFFLGVFAFLIFRWAMFEPYVIPSGSMIPSLLIFDHIFVSKYTYGLRFPFSQKWIVGPHVPERGEVVVFQSVEEDIVMIKRVVGLPGDVVEIDTEGSLKINGVPIEQSSISKSDLEAKYAVKIECADCDKFLLEKFEDRAHVIQLTAQGSHGLDGRFEVPAGHIFLLGDNRDRSRDSRYWGVLPLENLLGKARSIWLSCDKAASQAPVLCHPAYIRWQRLFSAIQ